MSLGMFGEWEQNLCSGEFFFFVVITDISTDAVVYVFNLDIKANYYIKSYKENRKPWRSCKV
jgi:hypothetical protein